MADIEVTIKNNADEIRKALPEAVEAALIAIGLTAESYAKAYCPVDTGRLRNSISNTHDDDSAYIGTNVEYASFVELGTSRQRAQPYLKPACTDHTEEYKQLVKNALESFG